jgi:hypothetical protein
MNQPELSFEAVYRDQDLLEIEVKASNGRYAGVTKFYLGIDGEELRELIEKLQGFPRDVKQVIERKLGYETEEPCDRQGYASRHKSNPFYSPSASLKFQCIDNSGHTAVEIILAEENWSERESAGGKASFELLFEPAALDTFCAELSEVVKNKAGKAVLSGIG